MRKILRNHFGNASQNGLCLSGKCGIVIFDKLECKQFEGGCGITRKILVGRNCSVTHTPFIWGNCGPANCGSIQQRREL